VLWASFRCLAANLTGSFAATKSGQQPRAGRERRSFRAVARLARIDAPNLVVKPAAEEGVMLTLADAARHPGDTVLPLVVDSQLTDARAPSALGRPTSLYGHQSSRHSG